MTVTITAAVVVAGTNKSIGSSGPNWKMLCRNLLPGLLSAGLIAATRLDLHSPPRCERLNLDGWGNGHRLEGPHPGSEAGGRNDSSCHCASRPSAAWKPP